MEIFYFFGLIVTVLLIKLVINRKINKDYYKNQFEISKIIIDYFDNIRYSNVFWYEPFPFERKIDYVRKFSKNKSLIEKAFKIEKYDAQILLDMKEDVNILIKSLSFWMDKNNYNTAKEIAHSAKIFTHYAELIKDEYFDYDIYLQLKSNVEESYKNIVNRKKFLEMNLPTVDYLDRKYNYIMNNREQINNAYVNRKKIENSELLGNIDGKSLDDQQSSAVIIEESNMLTVAGAGSGKTLTISAKVLYLTRIKKINPEDILLLTFTKKAANEMTVRIKERLGVNVNATTFHSHGYSVLKEATGNTHLNILEDKEKEKIIEDYFKNEIIKDSSKVMNLLEFISIYMNIPYIIDEDSEYVIDFAKTQNLDTFFSMGTKHKQVYTEQKNNVIKILKKMKSIYYKNEKLSPWIVQTMDEVMRVLTENYHAKTDYTNDGNELEKLEKKIKKIISSIDVLENGLIVEEEMSIFVSELQKMTDLLMELRVFVLDGIHTLKSLSGFEVKSYEELIIANFLYLQGINYVYEYPYTYDTEKDKQSTKLKMIPDFYFPDHDVYLEHFGINKEGRLPQYSKAEEKRYLDGMANKREIHKKNNTTLVETYSFEVSDEDFFERLLYKLSKVGVIPKPLSNGEMYDLLLRSEKKGSSYLEFIKLMTSFLNIVKGENITELDLLNKVKEIQLERRTSLVKRKLLFLDLFQGLNQYYDSSKVKLQKIDFDDMINKSIELIKENKLGSYSNLKCIIIDEYQDVSGSKVRYLQSLKKVSNAKVFAVGDDWQSIYGFAGSDVGYFTHFSESFGYTKECFIETTYRNSQDLIDIAGAFVMENEEQLKKNLKSSNSLKNPIVDCGYISMKQDIVNTICNEYEKKSSFELSAIDIMSNDKLTSLTRYNSNFESPILLRELPFHIRYSELNNKLVDILTECVKDNALDVKIIGRTNSSIDFIKNGYLANFSMRTNKNGVIIKSNLHIHKNLKISYITAHASKGLEADATIIIGVENRLTGFPNKMIDDELLKIFKNHQESFKYAEERRLFYVALTRTKGKVYVAYEKSNPSIFIDQIFKCNDVSSKIICPQCKVGHITLRESRFNKFCGCSEYPYCRYQHSKVDILESKITCPSCGGKMIRKKGKYNDFYGCSNYQYIKCMATYNIVVDNGIERLVPGNTNKPLVLKPIEITNIIESVGEREDIYLSVNNMKSIDLMISLYTNPKYSFVFDQEILKEINCNIAKDNLFPKELELATIIELINAENNRLIHYLDMYKKNNLNKSSYINKYLSLVELIQNNIHWKDKETWKKYRNIFVMGKKYNANDFKEVR